MALSNDKFTVHVDMDAFFAAIEQRDKPVLQKKPVVVGADPKKGKGRGVVSTCSYEAREFGIHSAMPISIAYRRCPQAIFLPVDMEKYTRVSHQIYDLLYDFSPDIESVSIDEAFLDITGTYRLFGSPRDTCLLMKNQIKEKVGLTASVGLAPTKMAAKIASDLNKPNGFVEVTRDGLLDFLWPLDVGKIWGIGKKSETALRNIRIKTIGDLAKKDVGEITRIFGKNGIHFWQLANGMDDRDVETESETKSISNEITFERDTFDKQKIESVLMLLSEKVSNRLRQEGKKGRTITLKIRLEGFHTYTRATTVDNATNFVDTIYKEIKTLFDNFITKSKKVRLIGVKVSNLSLLGAYDHMFKGRDDSRRENIHKVVDKVKERFGENSICRAKREVKREWR